MTFFNIPWARLAIACTAFLIFICGAARSLANCPEEEQYARIAIKWIESEWPLRPANDPVTEYLQSLGRQLGGRVPGNSPVWNFLVIRDASPYAFSVGHGFIYVTEGAVTFARNESELAAILAHEIGHQLAGHFCQGEESFFDWNRLKGNNHTKKKVGPLSQVFDVEKEKEADRYAVRLMQQAGFDPHAMLEMIRRLPRGSAKRYFYLDERMASLEKLLASVPHEQLSSSQRFLKCKHELSVEQQ